MLLTVCMPLSTQSAEKVFSKASNHTKDNKYLQSNIYIIGPGDVLELNIYDAPELSGAFKVLIDGRVSFPLIGNVDVNGMTLEQASDHVRELISAQLIRPEIQLRVQKARPIRVSIIGEVERPGLYSLTISELTRIDGLPNTEIEGLPTVVDAIQKAGGITQLANLRDVRLQRRLPGMPIQYKATTLNLLDLVFEGDQRQNPLLFDGDTIKLGKAIETPKEAVELASVNLSPKVIEVNVIGEVNEPGRLKVMANTPLVQAILIAGGLKDLRANTGNVQLVRINRNGSATLKRFKFDMNSDASNEKNPPLRDGDTVKVQKNIYAKGTDAIGAVADPVSDLVTVWSLFKLIEQVHYD